jgi:CRP-like cAMP-binding protein
VVSLERTHTLALGTAQVAALRRQHPQVDRFLTGLLARHLSRTSALVLEALYLPVETRLARRLSQLARVYRNTYRFPAGRKGEEIGSRPRRRLRPARRRSTYPRSPFRAPTERQF